jgi:hypothetical protein
MNREEDKLQAEIVQWYSLHYGKIHDKCLFHCNNKAKNAIEGNRMKAMGVKTGVSDLILIVPKKIYFIELKTSKGKQGKEQKEFERQLNLLECNYVVIRTLEEFKKLCVKEYEYANYLLHLH